MTNRFEVRAIGQITDDSGRYIGVALEGDMDAVRSLGRVYGQPVAIVSTDLLDEAEKALAEIGAQQLLTINKADVDERGLDDVAATVLYDELSRVRSLARATLARIRGEAR